MSKKKETAEVVVVDNGRPLTAKERLAQKAKKTPPTEAKKKPRDVIEIGKDEESKVYADAVDRLTAAVHARKAIEGHEKAAKAVAIPYVREIVLREWIGQGRKTENPRVQTPNGSSFILQCKDTLSGARGFRVPKDDSGEPIDIQEHLANHHVPEPLISRVMGEEEFKDELIVGVNMTKLEKQFPNLAERLLDLIDAACDGGVTTSDGREISFSDKEAETILEKNHDVTVKEGFLERSIAHCLAAANGDEQTAFAMLDKLLEAVPPQWAVGQSNCLHPDEGILKLLHEEPVAVSTKVETVDSPDKKYTFRIDGNKVFVVRNSDKKEVAAKKCHDSQHANNTVKKWQRDPSSLTEFIAEQA